MMDNKLGHEYCCCRENLEQMGGWELRSPDQQWQGQAMGETAVLGCTGGLRMKQALATKALRATSSPRDHKRVGESPFG